MRHRTHQSVFLAALVLAGAWCAQARADVTTGGQVVPADPATWTTHTYATVGKDNGKSGWIKVDGGDEIRSGSGTLGDESGSTGAATVTGAGSRWDAALALYVGYEGTGSLTISDGGWVVSYDGTLGCESGSNGTVTVTGAGSWGMTDFLTVGRYGAGTLTVSDGGAISRCDDGYLGRYSGSVGKATVTGVGSKWHLGIYPLFVGYSGTGTLTIADGGVVKNRLGILGRDPGSNGTATVTGAGSLWDLSYANLHVGGKGTVSLTISDGGKVKVGQTLYASEKDLYGDGTIETSGWVLDADVKVTSATGKGTFGLDGGSDHTLTVHYDQTGSVNNIRVGAGYRGTGSLTISDGGVVKCEHGDLGYWPGSVGTATVTGAGSVWDVTEMRPFVEGLLRVGYRGTGTLTISDGGVVEGGDVSVGHYKCTGSLTIKTGGMLKSDYGYLGPSSGSTGTATVTGTGSRWVTSGLRVGHWGTGSLTIKDGGLVSVAGMLKGYGFINMYGDIGGMLALKVPDAKVGDFTDGVTLAEFLDLVDSTDAIRYWDKAASDWAAITGATEGTDYTLEYFDSEHVVSGVDLNDYTLLTVMPEPATLALMAAGIVGLAARRRRR